MKLVSFIGTGKMGGALASAVIKKVGGEKVILSDNDISKAEQIAKNSGAVCEKSEVAVKNAKFIFLGVKPQMMAEVAKTLKPCLEERNDKYILISMAAGTSIKKIEDLFGKCPVIRIMPNTPVAVNKGMILYCANDLVENGDIEEFCDMLSVSGELDSIDEKLIDAASAVSGSGPAFVYMFIQAMADGGTLCGLPRDKALKYAIQTTLGAATLALNSDKHPEQLKDDVCSPGGTTIEGVRTMEENGVRGAMINAVKATFEKTKKL